MPTTRTGTTTGSAIFLSDKDDLTLSPYIMNLGLKLYSSLSSLINKPQSTNVERILKVVTFGSPTAFDRGLTPTGASDSKTASRILDARDIELI